MPWHVERGNSACPDGWAVVKDADKTVEGCHPSRDEAVTQLRALYANEPMTAADEILLPPVADVLPDMPEGTPWEGVLAPEGVWSGDGRQFAPDALTWAPLPLALKWQPEEDDEHKGSVIVGRIDEIFREPPLVKARGVMDDEGLYGAEALRLMHKLMLRGVSLKGDDMEDQDVELVYPGDMPMEAPMAEDDEQDDGLEEFHLPGKHDQKDHGRSTGPKYDRSKPVPVSPKRKSTPKYDRSTPPGQGGRRRYSDDSDRDFAIQVPEVEPLEPVEPVEMLPAGEPRVIIHKGRIRSATLCPEQAFVEAEIHLVEPQVLPELVGPTRVVASGYTITIPELWPESWFDEPKERPPFGALHITPQGRVYGLLAPAHVSHRAFLRTGRAVTAPQRVDYSEFQNKPALVAGADGDTYRINAGSITFNCGHPSPTDPRRSDPNWAMQQYDNTCSVAARVRVGEYADGGTWVAGGLLHGIDADTVERMMACALSGDWQGGKLNAALLVPVEGFPTAATSSVRIKDGALVSSTVPIRFTPEPDLRPLLERVARSIGRDSKSRLQQQRDRVKGRR